MQETSLIAYRTVLPYLGRRQAQVMKVFVDGAFARTRLASHPIRQNLTNMEVASALGWSICRVTPRVGELRRKGLLKFSERRPCRVTGNLAMAWTLDELTPDYDALLTKYGDYAMLNGYVPRQQWLLINRSLQHRGYKYVGEGVWELT